MLQQRKASEKVYFKFLAFKKTAPTTQAVVRAVFHAETILFDKDGTFIDLHYFWGKMTEMRASSVINAFNLSEDFFEKLCSFLEKYVYAIW